MKIILLSPNDFLHLSTQQKSQYQLLIKEELWCCLEGKDPWGITNAEIHGAVALGANEELIGLAIVSFRMNMRWAKLLSFYILPPFAEDDNKLLELLSAIEQKLRSLNCNTISYIYTSGDSTDGQMQRIYAQAGWNPPFQHMARLFFYTADFHPIWLEEYRKLPLEKGYQLFPWRFLRTPEREMLVRQHEENAFPASISPFFEESRIEPLNSIGIRYNKKLAGWLITYRADAETISYSSVFVYPEFRNSYILLALGSHSLELQQQSNMPKFIVEINLQQSDHGWIAFVKKRFLPHAYKVERLYEIIHNLSD
ncbi:MAG: hypothetical protein H0W50_00955 [Parachlamydiaceae bacterium]|nr:hypothetical protein [Parachlamydiaceae bacterium]